MYASCVNISNVQLFCHWNLPAWQNLILNANSAYSWATPETFDCLFLELFHSTSVTSEWWETAGAVEAGGEEEKRWDSVVEIGSWEDGSMAA